MILLKALGREASKEQLSSLLFTTCKSALQNSRLKKARQIKLIAVHVRVATDRISASLVKVLNESFFNLVVMLFFVQ